MGIQANHIVDVSIAVGGAFPARSGFGTLMIVTNEAGTIGLDATTRATGLLANMDEVTAAFASNTEAYKAASAYFGQNPRPKKLKIGFRGALETVTDALDAIQTYDSDWYGFAFTNTVRDNDDINGEGVDDAAVWAESRRKVFATASNDVNALDSTDTTDIIYALKNSTHRRSMGVYSSTEAQYPDASALGRAFSVDFSQPNSAITLNYKQLPGISAEALKSGELNGLLGKNGNAFVTIGGVNMFTEGKMASGVFFDEVHGLDWLEDAIENNVFGYLYGRPNKTPYTESGIAGIQQQVGRALAEGVRAGLLAPGYTVDGEFLPNGYRVDTVPLSEVAQADKENRRYNGCSFIAIGAGAIHGAQISGVFER